MTELDRSKNAEQQDGPIQAIFLSEFHVVNRGIVISVQVPPDYIGKEHFHAINSFILPKPQLQRSIVTVNVLDHKIVGYPIQIDSQKYARNIFYFNLCFVFHEDTRTVQYEPIVQKVSEYLILLEEDNCFLSNADNQPRLEALLQRILHDLNASDESHFVEGDMTVFLKVMRQRPAPPKVRDHNVPHIAQQRYRSVPLEAWDLTTQQILPLINGVWHVKRIAALSNVDAQLVKSCIQNLVYYGVVQLLPILKYSNVYRTHNLHALTKDPDRARLCQDEVQMLRGGRLPSLRSILSIYAAMTHGVTLKTICQRFCPREQNIDERKLVTFGLQNNLIRIIHKYPIYTGSAPEGRQKLYTGLLSFDEICCKTDLTPAKIDEDIDSDASTVVIWK